LAWIVVFWRLGYTTFLDPDEAHYAQMTREMLHSGSWLVPLLDGHPYIDKPVLFHWLQGLSMLIFGETEFAGRLPSALAAIALFAATYRLGKALFSSEVGEWAAIMLATIPATFALSSIAIFDMVFTAFLFSGLSCLLIVARGGRACNEQAGYVLLALAVLTKGPVALVLVGMFFALAWLAGGELRGCVRALHCGRGLLVAALIASPWFVWMHGRFGPVFVQGYVLGGNVFYLTQPESFSGRAVNHTFYLRAFVAGFFPWTFVLLGRGVDLARRRWTALPWSTNEKLLWLWVAVVVGLFSAARFKLDHYIFPAAPACCLIAANAWKEAAARRSAQIAGTRCSVLGLAAVLITGGAFVATAIFELDLELPAAAILLPLTLAIGGAMVLARSARIDWHVPGHPAWLPMTMVVIYALIVTIGFPTLQRARPTALAGRVVRQATARDTPVGLYRLENWRASLRYYAERPLTRLSSAEEVAGFAASDAPVFALMIRRDYRELRQQGVRIYEVFRCRAVVGTVKTRSGFRRQKWDDLIVVANAAGRRRPVALP
jgi:4-amino-4-deoxy-L-arabinose transferase-like glycosyltransferase